MGNKESKQADPPICKAQHIPDIAQPVQKYQPLLYTGDHVLPDARDGDVGIDLTARKLVKQISANVAMYDTEIAVQPLEGYYVDVVARSSIVKSGYMLANGIGVIDPTYTGTIKLVLVKIDPDAAPLELPFTLAQLVMRPYIKIRPIFTVKFEPTIRGSGGFGSTNADESKHDIAL